MTERRVLHERGDEDLGLFECVPGYPAEDRLGSLKDVSQVFWIVTGPEDVMFPTRRRRTLGAILNRRTTCWNGPPTLEGMRADFRQRFFTHTTAPVCVFFSDSDDTRMAHYLEVINKRPGQKDANFTAVEVSGWSDAELQQHLFPAGFNARFQSWKELRNETHGDGDLPFIFDGDHHPGQSSSGTDVPPLLTRGHIIRLNNDDTWQIATPQEHYKPLGYKFPNKLGDIFKNINAVPTMEKVCRQWHAFDSGGGFHELHHGELHEARPECDASHHQLSWRER
jgi:hypothetical protein